MTDADIRRIAERIACELIGGDDENPATLLRSYQRGLFAEKLRFDVVADLIEKILREELQP